MKTYSKIVSVLFFIFFSLPILSPSINGNTVYIFWIMPIIDIFFDKYILNLAKYYLKDLNNNKIKCIPILIIIILMIWLVFIGKMMAAVKILIIIYILFYLKYCSNNGYFKYLYMAVNINIIIAIIQFILYYTPFRSVAFFIGPTNIAHLIYGNYATLTYDNMFPIFGLVRVSGWSREAGFFASLIITTSIVYMYDKQISKKTYQYILFVIAFCISFSKISFISVIFLIFYVMRKFVNKIPGFLICIVVYLGITFVAILANNIGFFDKFENTTWTHRFSGYVLQTKLNTNEIIYGVDNLNSINENAKKNCYFLEYINKYDVVAGLSNLVVHYGVITAIMIYIVSCCLRINSLGYIFVILFTCNVTLFTSDSFVMLVYYVVLMMQEKDKKMEVSDENINN